MASIDDLDIESMSAITIGLRPGTWVAMDQDGTWFQYENKPQNVGDEWLVMSKDPKETGKIRRLNDDLFVVPKRHWNWKKSLFQVQ